MKIPITPVPKPRMTKSDRWKKRVAVVRYWGFCDILREAWGDRPFPERVYLEFGVPIPKSYSKARRARMAGLPHQQRPDIDNYAKAVLDALCVDDSYIWELHAQKFWSEEPYIVIGEA